MAARLDLRHDPEIVHADRQRGHRFQPPARDLARIPALGATEATPCDEKVLHLHYFQGSADWYVAELDPETWRAFGWARITPGGGEWGYFDLAELATAWLRLHVHGVTEQSWDSSVPAPLGSWTVRIERDKWWQPAPLPTNVPR